MFHGLECIFHALERIFQPMECTFRAVEYKTYIAINRLQTFSYYIIMNALYYFLPVPSAKSEDVLLKRISTISRMQR